jgi:hypothetical protein
MVALLMDTTGGILELDRQRVSSLGHSQHIIDQRFLFLSGEVLLLGAFLLD